MSMRVLLHCILIKWKMTDHSMNCLWVVDWRLDVMMISNNCYDWAKILTVLIYHSWWNLAQYMLETCSWKIYTNCKMLVRISEKSLLHMLWQKREREQCKQTSNELKQKKTMRICWRNPSIEWGDLQGRSMFSDSGNCIKILEVT